MRPLWRAQLERVQAVAEAAHPVVDRPPVALLKVAFPAIGADELHALFDWPRWPFWFGCRWDVHHHAAGEGERERDEHTRPVPGSGIWNTHPARPRSLMPADFRILVTGVIEHPQDSAICLTVMPD